MRTNHRLFVLGLLLAGLGTATAATVIYDNLNISGTSYVVDYLETLGYTSAGNQFITDASGYTLSSVTLQLRPISPGTINVKLFSDAGGHPGADLYTIFSGAGPTLAGNVPYGGLNYALDANTSYWIVLDSGGLTSTTDWSYDSANTQPAGVGTQPTLNAGSTDHGLNWARFDVQPFAMQVTGDAVLVPEPGAILVMILGGAAFAVRRYLCRS